MLLIYDISSNIDIIKCVDFQWKGTVRTMKEGAHVREWIPELPLTLLLFESFSKYKIERFFFFIFIPKILASIFGGSWIKGIQNKQTSYIKVT